MLVTIDQYKVNFVLSHRSSYLSIAFSTPQCYGARRNRKLAWYRRFII